MLVQILTIPKTTRVPCTSFPEGKQSNKIMEGTSPPIKIFKFENSRCLQICKANLRILVPYRSFPVFIDSPWSSDFSKHMSEDDFTGGDAVVAVYHQKYLGLFWTRLHPFGRQILGRVLSTVMDMFFKKNWFYLATFFPSGVQSSSSVGELCHVEKVWKSPETPNGHIQWGGWQNPWDSQWVNNIYSCLRTYPVYNLQCQGLVCFLHCPTKTIKRLVGLARYAGTPWLVLLFEE